MTDWRENARLGLWESIIPDELSDSDWDDLKAIVASAIYIYDPNPKNGSSIRDTLETFGVRSMLPPRRSLRVQDIGRETGALYSEIIHTLLDEIAIEQSREGRGSSESDPVVRNCIMADISNYLLTIERFYRTKNRELADMAYRRAIEKGYPVGGILKYVMLDAMAAAQQKETKPSKVEALRVEYLPTGFAVIEAMVASGIPLDEAAARASRLLDTLTDGGLCYKASSLAKMYSAKARGRSSTRADPATTIKRSLFVGNSIGQPEVWRAAFPMPNDAMLGTRR